MCITMLIGVARCGGGGGGGAANQSAERDENKIIENINFLSQTKPSRLRSFLLADLWRAITPTARAAPDENCLSEADMKISSVNCTCSAYSCAPKTFNFIKQSRSE